MTTKKLLITFFVLLSGTILLAQKNITEVTLTYSISIQNTDKGGAVLNEAINTLYIKGGFSRMDMTSNLGNEKTIYDSKAGNAVILKEYSGQKLMITLTKENWLEKNKRADGVVFTEQTEKKEILGYQCVKATATLNDGSVLTVFYTKDILLQNKEYDPLFKNLPGLPMQYEVTSGKLKFIYTISKIDPNSIAQTKFDLPKAGYRVITYAENKQGNK